MELGRADCIKSILLTAACSIALAPITLLIASIETGSFLSDALAWMLTIALCCCLAFIVNFLFRQPCQSHLGSHENSSKTSAHVFASEETSHTKRKRTTHRRRIESKYFRPSYIISELMTIWGTTYTVITWGSVWVIGGTIVATEQLAHKIKSKCTRERGAQDPSRPNDNSFAPHSSFTSSSSSASSHSNSTKRLRSWAKRSYASVKKHFHRFAGHGRMPQLTTGLHTNSP